jgi:hypothetical protein
MITILGLFVSVLVSPFKTQVQLEAEIVLLRHQLNVLRRRVPSKPRLTAADRMLFVWLHRLYPSVLSMRSEATTLGHQDYLATRSSFQILAPDLPCG